MHEGLVREFYERKPDGEGENHWWGLMGAWFYSISRISFYATISILSIPTQSPTFTINMDDKGESWVQSFSFCLKEI